MFRSDQNIPDSELQVIRFQHESEVEHLKDVCERLGITPSEMFSMHEGSFNHRPIDDQLRFHAARDLGNFYKRKYEASRKTRDLIRKKEISETNEDFKQYLERRDQRKKGTASVTFSQKNIDETSRKRAGYDDNSIASTHSSKNSWVSNVTKSSYLGESILDCEGSIENSPESAVDYSGIWPSYREDPSVDENYEYDQDFSFDTVDGSLFRPHPKLMSTQNKNEEGMKARWRNSTFGDPSLSGRMDTNYDMIASIRRGHCQEGYRGISGSGNKLNDLYWTAHDSQLEMESQMYDDDDEYDSCPLQSSKFIPH